MIIRELPLMGLKLVESQPFGDHRGRFARLFCADELKAAGVEKPIAQINHSFTAEKGTVRGMHFQYPPHAELKIVRCLQGAVFDVAIDLRKGSPTYLQWHAELLTRDNHRALIIPEGFAHGFQTVEPDAELLYLHTAFYAPESEGGIRHDDPTLDITWPEVPCGLSERDRKHPLIDDNFQGITL